MAAAAPHMKVYWADTMPGDTASHWGSILAGQRSQGSNRFEENRWSCFKRGCKDLCGREEEGGGIHLLERLSGWSESNLTNQMRSSW